MQGGQAEPIRVYDVFENNTSTYGTNIQLDTIAVTLVQIPTHPDHDWTPGVPNTPCLTE